jgi:3-oxoacid CoA-transferase
VITDLAAMRFVEGKLRLVDLMPGATLDEVRAKTGIAFVD